MNNYPNNHRAIIGSRNQYIMIENNTTDNIVMALELLLDLIGQDIDQENGVEHSTDRYKAQGLVVYDTLDWSSFIHHHRVQYLDR